MCDVAVTTPFVPPLEGKDIKTVKVKGLWDTGATGSVINRSIADTLGIKPIGRTKVHHADGESETNVYLVNILLPNNVGIPGVRVTEGKITGADMLIGMDIITLGDFSITNHKGVTVMSFRIPSCHEIDYVRLVNEYKQKQQIEKYLPQLKHKHRRR